MYYCEDCHVSIQTQADSASYFANERCEKCEIKMFENMELTNEQMAKAKGQSVPLVSFGNIAHAK